MTDTLYMEISIQENLIDQIEICSIYLNAKLIIFCHNELVFRNLNPRFNCQNDMFCTESHTSS